VKTFGWKGAIGLLISAVCLYFSFRNFQWVEAFDRARHANIGLLLLATVAATGMFPLRARRWRTILDPVAPRLPFGPLWRATAIGVMMTNVIPARAGELARPYALAREVPEVPFSMGLASVLVDRLFDAIVVLLLLGISMAASSFPSGVVVSGYPISRLATGFALVPVVLLVVLYSLVFFPEKLVRLFELLARRVSPAVEAKGVQMLRKFASGLSVLKNPRHFGAVFLWTLLHWLLQPLAFWLGLRAFGIDVPWVATLFVQGVIVVAVAAPSSPGFVGLFELAAMESLAVYGVSKTDAGTWAIAYHLFSAIPITLMGAYYFARAGFSMSDIGATPPQPASAPAA
jgi:uncharacterized protein (TIRG00374 family)